MANLMCNVRILQNQTYCAYFFLLRLTNHRRKSISVEVDALDVFTTHLVQEKANKWENLKLKTNVTPALTQKVNKIENVNENITVNTLSSALQEGIDENNIEKVMEVLKDCKENKMVSFNVMVNILNYFAQIGHIEGIKYIQEMYREINPTALQIHGYFQQYLAEAIWVKGNIPKALTLFYDVYKNNSFLRGNIRIVLRNLFYNAAQKNSEAVMVAISKFSEDIAKEFQDYSPLNNLWKICLLSEWYSDQVLAIQLLERNEKLLKVILTQISYIVGLALKYHKTESVYKLLEILLKYDCKSECSLVLISLFDYKIRQRDLYSCSQILKWSTKYNILLPALHQEKVLQLLLKTNQPVKTVKGLEQKDYNLKF